MKAGFFHDSPLILNQGNFYSRTLSSDIWNRYLGTFDELLVSTRVLELDHKGMKISSHPKVSFNPISAYVNPVSLLTNFPTIVHQIRSTLSEVDCAVVRLPSVIGWVTCVVARRMKKPVLIELVGCPWDAYRFHSAQGVLMAPIGHVATRLAVLNSSFTIYVTQKFLQQRYPTKGKSVGVSNVNISTEPSRLDRRFSRINRMEDRKTLSRTSDDRIVLGSIGKVDLSYKGYKSALKAVSLLIQKGYNIEYEIVGPGEQGELRDFISRLGLAGRVRLNGSFSSSEVDAWFDTIDLYIQPSLTEGLPRSVIEAMAHGLPVILSKAGGQPELVDSEFLFKPGDSKALAERISSFINIDWVETARRNFEKSTEYELSELQARRECLLREFKTSVLQGPS